MWYVRASWSDVRAVPCELFPSGLHLCLIASATVNDTCNESVNPFVTRFEDMAPFTHHQWPCLLGSPTHVVIQRHLQLSLLQHRTDGFDVNLSLCPCRQVPSMKQVMAIPSQYESFSNLLRLPEMTEYLNSEKAYF